MKTRQKINRTDLKTYEPRSKVKRGLGIACLIIAIAPNGLAPVFYPLSFWLLGIGKKEFKQGLYSVKVRLKYGRWA